MRKFFLLSLTLLFAGLGCKGLSEEQKASVQPITLNYWTVFHDAQMLRTFAAEYQQIRPYVKVNVLPLRYEEFEEKFVTALADDVGPDVVSMHTRWIREHAGRLSAMPPSITVANIQIKQGLQSQTIITEETKQLPTAGSIEKNYVSTVAKDVIIDGGVYGLPLALDTLALYYNKDLMHASGIPQPPTTWDQLLDAVKKATKFDAQGNIVQHGIALGTGNNIEHAPDMLALLLMQNQVTITKDGLVTFANGLEKATPNHPVLQTLRFYTDFARPTKEAYSWNEQKTGARQAFELGQSVFYIGFAFDYTQIKARAPQRNIDVVPIPQLAPTTPTNVANYWVESVVKKSPHQNESWDFVRYITSPENVRRYTAATRQPTPLLAQITEQLEDPLFAPFVSQVLTAENWYRGRDSDVAASALRALITDYLRPYADGENPLKRDANLGITTAKIIQQTM